MNEGRGYLMPVLSRFYGIVIRMYFQQSEHNPPHFHAIYGEYMAAICINDGTILEGELPNKALEMVRNSVVLAVYLLFSVACFLTVHEHSLIS